MASYLYHIIETDQWLGFDKNTELKPQSLNDEGFIHCSFAYQVCGTLRKHFKQDQQLTLLRILKNTLKGELKVENNYGGLRLFPHLYAAIPGTAIVDSVTIMNPHEFGFPKNWRDPEEFIIREIEEGDNEAVLKVITSVMTEYGAVGAGFSIEDSEVSNMFASYQDGRAKYYVVETNNEILGCGGLGPLRGGDSKISEIKKMYFMPDLRGFGVAITLMEKCLLDASILKYESAYLETFHTMTEAQEFYLSFGFERINQPLGDTGHGGCDIFFRKNF